MNLMINNYCNLHCSYCFAQEEMHSKKAMNITMENFITFLDFLKHGNEHEVRLIGGEPTLHPELDKLIDKVIEYNYFDRILIFSNFTFPPEVALMFIEKSKKIKIDFLPNINQFNLLIPKYKENILHNLDLITSNMKNVYNIGINLYDPNMDLSQWEEIVAKYNIKKIRWSIVLPNDVLPEDFDFYKFHHSFQKVLLELVSWRVKYGVDLSCDCNGVPPCCLDDNAITYIMKVDPTFLGCINCEGPVIDLAPNLEKRGCFVVGCNKKQDKKKYLTDFEYEYQIRDYYEDIRSEKDGWPVRKECLSCPRFLMTGNSCSCLAYRKQELTRRR